MEDEEYIKKLKKKAKKTADPFEEEKPTTTKKSRTRGIYSFRTYVALRPMGWWFTLIGIGLFFVIGMNLVMLDASLSVNESELNDVQLLIGAVIGLILLGIIIGYIMYRGWIERLSFKISGWDQMMSNHPLGFNRYRYIRITLHPKANSDEHIPVMVDLMQVLFNRLDRINSIKLRTATHEWKKLSDLSITGPSNVYGLRRLRRTLRREFNEISKRLDCFTRVEIYTTTTEFYDKPTPRDRTNYQD